MRLGDRPEDQLATPTFGNDIKRIEQRQSRPAFHQLLQHFRCIALQHRLNLHRKPRQRQVYDFAQTRAGLGQQQPLLYNISQVDRPRPDQGMAGRQYDADRDVEIAE